MPIATNTGTKDIPLQFAKQLTTMVNQEWENGAFISKVSPVTQDLLRYWFKPAFCDMRAVNFHAGQKQAILNAIYCHEILKTDSILSMYQQASEDLLSADFLNYIGENKYNHPKYCVKMATGTGKTLTSLNCLLNIYHKFHFYKALILVPTITLVEQCVGNEIFYTLPPIVQLM